MNTVTRIHGLVTREQTTTEWQPPTELQQLYYTLPSAHVLVDVRRVLRLQGGTSSTSAPEGGSIPHITNTSEGHTNKTPEDRITNTSNGHIEKTSERYCPENACINAFLSHLHHRLLDEGGMHLHVGMDTCLYACALLRDVYASGSVCADTAAAVRLQCICEDPAHTIHVACNRAATGALDWNPFRSKHRKGPCVQVPLASFISSPHDVLTYHGLPDIGGYIRAMVTEHLYGHHVHKRKGNSQHHTAGEARDRHGAYASMAAPEGRAGEIYPSARIRMHLDNIHARTVGEAGRADVLYYSHMRHSMCACVVRESLPFMKIGRRVYKNINVLKQATVSQQDVGVCLKVMHGTLLSLYPSSAKKLTFMARSSMLWRLRQLLVSDLQAQVQFIQTHINLVKLCFMEYLFNVFIDFMPCERGVLHAFVQGSYHDSSTGVSYAPHQQHRQQNAGVHLSEYERAYISMFDHFRQDSLLTGTEVSTICLFCRSTCCLVNVSSHRSGPASI